MNPNQAMAESLGEQLSALMDGELARDQVRFLLRGVETHSDLARRWSNYHLVGATLKREFVAFDLPADFADGVMGRLDEVALAAATVPSSRRIGFGALRWVGGGAIAAAVAVVALNVSRPVGNANAPAVAVAQQSPSPRSSAQPYLPLARPLLNTASPVFDYDTVRQASFEQVVPNYYPQSSRVELMPGRAELARIPYVVRLPVRDASQQAAESAQR